MSRPEVASRPDRHLAELYDLTADPDETKNLIKEPGRERLIAELRSELDQRIVAAGATPDKMPLDEGIKSTLPDLKIR